MTAFRRYLNSMPRKAPIALFVLLAAAAAAPSGAAAAAAVYDGISADGSVAIFSTSEKMVTGDTDGQEDVYERTFDAGLGEYVTRQVSLGPKGGNQALPSQYSGISEDGSEVFFSTKEQLVIGDTDAHEDVYVRNLLANRTLLVSQGGDCPAPCGNGPEDSSFVPGGVVPDGGRVFFATTEKLSAADEDGGALDVYRRDVEAETTVLVSAAASSCSGCGNDSKGAFFRATDLTGDRVFFTSTEKLTSADGDSATDIYVRDIGAGTTQLVSVAGTCPPDLPVGQNCNPTFGGASPDGSHVFFETNDRTAAGDLDSSQDVYDWSGGPLVLASIGPDGGNGTPNVTYAGTSADGGTVYFHTTERLDTAADTDEAQDVYRRTGATTALVSAGSEGLGNGEVDATFQWASPDGSTEAAVFSTRESLVGADTDEAQDVYERAGGVTTLLSTGSEGAGGEFDAAFSTASNDGSRVFFLTSESLSSKDSDENSDIYVRSASDAALVSTGPVGGNGAFSAGLHGVSDDGSFAFFVTDERLTVDDDFNNEADVYSWSSSGTLLVSVKNSPDLILGPPPPALENTIPASPAQSTNPTIVGQAESGATIKIYSTFNCSGEPVAQGTAEELASPGLTVGVEVPLGSTTAYRATAEADGIVSACSAAISYTQQDPTPPGEEETPGSGETPTPPPAGGTSSGSGNGSGGGGTKTKSGIEYVTPQTRITFGPASKTRQRRLTFRFLDATGQPGTRFSCRVDKQRWVGCSSPFKTKRLGFGRHVFSVKAVNAVGTAGPSPVKRAFKVVRG